jgi:hypothetical protein
MGIGIEKKWPAVAPQLFTADGTAQGVVTVADARGFKVKMMVVIIGTGLPTLRLQIKRFISPTEFIVGPDKAPRPGQGTINLRADLSAYTTALTCFAYAEEQDKAVLTERDILQAVYEQEPATAIRTLAVDGFGQAIDSTTTQDGKTRLAVDAEVTVNTVQLFTKAYDSISAAYPDATHEVYKTFVGGLGGTLQETITVTYVDSSKNELVSVVRS